MGCLVMGCLMMGRLVMSSYTTEPSRIRIRGSSSYCISKTYFIYTGTIFNCFQRMSKQY